MERLLFETKVGDLLLWLFERLTGVVLVPREEVWDVEYVATEKGVAECTRHR